MENVAAVVEFMHLQKAFNYLGYENGSLPVVEIIPSEQK